MRSAGSGPPPPSTRPDALRSRLDGVGLLLGEPTGLDVGVELGVLGLRRARRAARTASTSRRFAASASTACSRCFASSERLVATATPVPAAASAATAETAAMRVRLMPKTIRAPDKSRRGTGGSIGEGRAARGRPPDPAADAVPDRRRQRLAAAAATPLTLVDAGPLMEETEARLEAGLAELGVAVEDLELIVLTHQHDDHVGLAGELRRRSGAAVAGTAALAACLADVGGEHGRGRRLLGRPDAPPRRDGEDGRDARGDQPRVPAVRRRTSRSTGSSPTADELVAGGRTWRVRERPGHSPTDTVLAGADVLLAGDHLLEKISSNPIAHVPIGAADPIALASAPGPAPHPRHLPRVPGRHRRRRPRRADPARPRRPVHRRRRARRQARRDDRAPAREKILAALDRPRTAADVGRDLWRHVPVTQAYLVLSEVLGHLDLLEDRGAVAAEDRDGVVVHHRTG